MKSITIIALLILSANVNAQKLKAYLASNGITYHVKDTVQLGLGSGANGSFLYLQMGGWAAIMSYDSRNGDDQLNIGRGYANGNVIIKKINQIKIKGAVKVYFTVGGGNLTNYTLYIDDAIQTCEVRPCAALDDHQPIEDKFDQLKKLKALLDGGAITQAEYEAEKKKLLNQ